jgi:hypothetical protein
VLVRRGLDAGGQGGGGAGSVLRFVAADAVSEGVVGDRPGAAERIARRRSREQGLGGGAAQGHGRELARRRGN